MEPRILIVEDDEASFLYLESVLKRTTALVTHVSNGEDAVDICRVQALSAVLMDLKMPGMDGFEATRIIRSFNASLPIIAITAYAMNGDEQRALDAGCNAYLSKPLKKERLFEKLESNGINLILR
jgi:CheY-like chemotaxis protein